jgi:hypothetical protein
VHLAHFTLHYSCLGLVGYNWRAYIYYLACFERLRLLPKRSWVLFWSRYISSLRESHSKPADVKYTIPIISKSSSWLSSRNFADCLVTFRIFPTATTTMKHCAWAKAIVTYAKHIQLCADLRPSTDSRWNPSDWTADLCGAPIYNSVGQVLASGAQCLYSLSTWLLVHKYNARRNRCNAVYLNNPY